MESQFTDEMLERIGRCGVIAVLVIDDAADGPDLARALLAGGIDVMELTLRTPAAIEALRAIRREVPEMLAGMGTILTPDQVSSVADAGGAFGVAPGTNASVIRQAQSVGLAFAPGIATASDIETAVELGCRELKFFPAEPSGGVKYLKSLAGPYAHLGLRFVPLGGLTAENVSGYLSLPQVTAVGGSWIAKREVIRQRNWQEITENAAQARRIVEETRTSGDK